MYSMRELNERCKENVCACARMCITRGKKDLVRIVFLPWCFVYHLFCFCGRFQPMDLRNLIVNGVKYVHGS